MTSRRLVAVALPLACSRGGSPAEGAYVDANGVHTWYEKRGSGPALVLLHGLAMVAEARQPQVEALAPDYALYVPERRGVGRTADVPGEWSYEGMAADTAAFMDALGLRDARVVGLSDGGIVVSLGEFGVELAGLRRRQGIMAADRTPRRRAMAQHGIETILMRRLASRLTMPVVLVDPRGDLVYFNEPAARLLGRRFDDATPILRDEWSAVFRPGQRDGSAMEREALPLFIATERREPSHQRGYVRGLDGAERDVEGIAFPLIGQAEHMLGAVGVFWNPLDPPPPVKPRSRRALDLASPGDDRPVELLLARQLASYLKTAIFLSGADGRLIFYNEPAERLLGVRFEEAEEVGVEAWSAQLAPTDLDGAPIPTAERPMIIALRRGLPAHRRYAIRGFDGVAHQIEGLAVPLVCCDGWQLGALGIFWEHPSR